MPAPAGPEADPTNLRKLVRAALVQSGRPVGPADYQLAKPGGRSSDLRYSQLGTSATRSPSSADLYRGSASRSRGHRPATTHRRAKEKAAPGPKTWDMLRPGYVELTSSSCRCETWRHARPASEPTDARRGPLSAPLCHPASRSEGRVTRDELRGRECRGTTTTDPGPPRDRKPT